LHHRAELRQLDALLGQQAFGAAGAAEGHDGDDPDDDE